MNSVNSFDLDCRLCPRLSEFLDQVKQDYPDYHARPVPAFGAKDPSILIVGLAPGLHGANASGRPFTGDFAGILLYETLHRFGLSTNPVSESKHDGLQLLDCRITNAVKCLPPQNKPIGAEINTCNQFLKAEMAQLKPHAGVIALGSIAHNAVIKALGLKLKDYKFAHASLHQPVNGPWIVDSYHCSRYNTQTKRLTEAMFQNVFEVALKQLSQESNVPN